MRSEVRLSPILLSLFLLALLPHPVAFATALDVLKPGQATASDIRTELGDAVQTTGSDSAPVALYTSPDKGLKSVTAWYDSAGILRWAKVELVNQLDIDTASILFALGDTPQSTAGNSFSPAQSEGLTTTYGADGVHFYVVRDVVREIWITPSHASLADVAKELASPGVPLAPPAKTPPVRDNAPPPAKTAPAPDDAPQPPQQVAPPGPPPGRPEISQGQAWFGAAIVTSTKDTANQYGVDSTPGAIVAEVSPGGPAEKAGIAKGDIITLFDAQRIRSAEDLVSAVAARYPGDSVRIEYLRAGKTASVNVTLGRRADKPPLPVSSRKRGDLGFVLKPVTADVVRQKGLAGPEGAYVFEVIKGRAAALAGIRAGDVITMFDGSKVQRIDELRKLLSNATPGSTVTLQIIRDGQPLSVSAVTEELR